MNDWIRKPIAPPAHIAYAHKLGRGMLTFQQIEELVKPINQAYVEKKQGMTYLAQHQARAEMNRIVGYGNWDSRVLEMILMYETFGPTGKDNKDRWTIGYRAHIEVNIRDLWGMPLATFSEWHAEENAPQPNRGEAHALALTSVESYALRRALIGLGDRFGLGLYNGGSLAAHGQYTNQLEPGQLFEWAQVGEAPPAAAPVVQPTHETIQAEPAVVEQPASEEFVTREQAPAHTPEMQRFRDAAATAQADRDAIRERMQQGLKQDEHPQG